MTWNWRNLVLMLVAVNVLCNVLIFFWPGRNMKISPLRTIELVRPMIPGNGLFDRATKSKIPKKQRIFSSRLFTKAHLGRVEDNVNRTAVDFAPSPPEVRDLEQEPELVQKPLLFRKWLEKPAGHCDGLFTSYGNGDLVELRDVVVDTSKAIGNRGGESLEAVLSQKEDSEFYKYADGFFVLPCQPNYHDFHAQNHLRDWLRVLKGDKQLFHSIRNASFIPGITVAITRYEYANVYWTLIDLHTVYLVTRFLNVSPKLVNILIVDGHPKASLDPLWSSAFKSVLRIRDLGKAARFERLVWGMDRGKTPLIVKQKTVPLLPEFRNFMLKANKVPVKHDLDCEKLRILFVWRRDYINHPRNPAGIISRKITNERELVFAVKNAHPRFNVTEILLENLTVGQQLSAFSNSDVLIGMHGAGFAQCAFLQPGSAVIEFFPKNFGENWHFEYLAKWSGLHYSKWKNNDTANEDTRRKSTKIPPHVVVDNLNKVMKLMCLKTNVQTS